MPSINYRRLWNEPDDEPAENIGVSVIAVPEDEPPSTPFRDTDSEPTQCFSKYNDCFKSTALAIYVKLCIVLVIVLHLALGALGLSYWYSHSHHGNLSEGN